ncbi:MAG: hypothetical protein KTR31_02335 [Myxococcales bacterium]|nr:hypothetical protein [Myxococcales bacterium]
MIVSVLLLSTALPGCGSATAEEAVADSVSPTAEAAATLARNCPYNRAAMQVPLVLQHELTRTDIDGLPWPAQWRWAEMASHVEQQIARLESLGALQLPLPEAGDYLASQPDLLTRAELSTHPDPMAATQALLDRVGALVKGYDEATRATITQATDTLYVATGNPWPPKHDTSVVEALLADLVPLLEDHPAQDRVERMLKMVQGLTTQGC